MPRRQNRPQTTATARGRSEPYQGRQRARVPELPRLRLRPALVMPQPLPGSRAAAAPRRRAGQLHSRRATGLQMAAASTAAPRLGSQPRGAAQRHRPLPGPQRAALRRQQHGTGHASLPPRQAAGLVPMACPSGLSPRHQQPTTLTLLMHCACPRRQLPRRRPPTPAPNLPRWASRLRRKLPSGVRSQARRGPARPPRLRHRATRRSPLPRRTPQQASRARQAFAQDSPRSTLERGTRQPSPRQAAHHPSQ